MRAHGFSIVEVLIGAVILATLIGILMSGTTMLGRQSNRAFDALSQIQDVQLLMETVRLELASIVMNPFGKARHHENNSFVISQPNRTSIQFVTERQEGADTRRYLVYYQCQDRPGIKPGTGLQLTKKTWKFLREDNWNEHVKFPPGWPATWLGPQVESDDRYAHLNIQHLSWTYLVPEDKEGRVFFRIKLVVASGARLLPFSTLVAVRTPDVLKNLSFCRSLFAPCFEKTRNCFCQPSGSSPAGTLGGAQ